MGTTAPLRAVSDGQSGQGWPIEPNPFPRGFCMRVSRFRLAVPAAACAVVLGLSGGNAGALTASARVRPARALTNSQVVKVHWHAFDPTQDQGGLVILQCTSAFATDGMH